MAVRGRLHGPGREPTERTETWLEAIFEAEGFSFTLHVADDGSAWMTRIEPDSRVTQLTWEAPQPADEPPLLHPELQRRNGTTDS